MSEKPGKTGENMKKTKESNYRKKKEFHEFESKRNGTSREHFGFCARVYEKIETIRTGRC